MSSDDFNEYAFHNRMSQTMEVVAKVLDASRRPKYAAEVHHQYMDKYALAEFVTNCAIASQINCLLSMGLGSEQIKTVCSWRETHGVSLKFRAVERCSFLREETRDVESSARVVEEVKVAGQSVIEATSKVVTTVKEYFWRFGASCELMVVRGVGATADDHLHISDYTGCFEIKTPTNLAPYPETKSAGEYEVNISWLVQNLHQDTASPMFSVNRESTKCFTPRRNEDVELAFNHFRMFLAWSRKVSTCMRNVFEKQPNHGLDMSSISAEGIFAPVLPVLQEQQVPAGPPQFG